MKVKTLISTVMFFILVSQPAFGCSAGQQKISWQGGWIIIRMPTTPMPFPMFFPYQPGQLERRGHFRSNRNFFRERSSYKDPYKPFAKRTVRVRMPKW